MLEDVALDLELKGVVVPGITGVGDGTAAVAQVLRQRERTGLVPECDEPCEGLAALVCREAPWPPLMSPRSGRFKWPVQIAANT